MNTLMIVLLVAVFIGLFVVILLVIQYIYGTRKREKDGTIILNLMSHLFNEPALSVQIGTKKGNHGRELATVIPKDVSNDISNDIDKIEPVKMIKDRERSVILPKGTQSQYRDIEIIFPGRAEDFHPIWRKTFVGRAFMFATELANADIDAIAASIRAGSQAKTDFVKLMGDGEATRAAFAYLMENMEDFKKFQETAKKEQPIGSIPGFKKPEG